MRKFYFNAEARCARDGVVGLPERSEFEGQQGAARRRGFVGHIKGLALSVFCLMAAFSASAYTTDGNGTATVTVPQNAENDKNGNAAALEDLKNALADASVSTVILTAHLVLTSGTELVSPSEGVRKVVRLPDPFLPEDGSVRVGTENNKTVIVSPAADEYTKDYLFLIKEGSKVTIGNLTLMGGFTGERDNPDQASVGGIDNYGYLEMHDVDMLRTGTALLNRPGARAALIHCNIVRNANWYGGGILNFAERVGTEDEYINGGTLVMDCCSLTENESLGPQHGGGAAENQGLMCLNNCVVANNASTEIGGGINNCKGGELFVMNSTFTGNITTSKDYQTDAGGAIGNAGGASHVHIVNSILAYNGYDDGTRVDASSLGRYTESQEIACSLIHSVYDAMSGMPTAINDTGTTKEYSGLINNVAYSGIIAAGATGNGGKTSAFNHPLVTSSNKDTDPWALAPSMSSQTADHYIFRNAVATYFDYSELFEGDEPVIGMAYDLGNERIVMGTAVVDTDKKVETTFSGGSRSPNFIGACAVLVKSDDDTTPPVKLFWVELGEFTGGRVSGVTIYRDSYISNTVITVHAYPDSAHYLDGWIINGEKVEGSAQKNIFSFPVTTDIVITPIFAPVVTQIVRVRQRYPWNNLVDIDYTVAEKDVIDYRLVFIASFVTNGVRVTMQLKSFVDNAGKNTQGLYTPQRLGEKIDLRKDGPHRVTWDSAADGVRLKDGEFSIKLLACEGDER